MSKVNRSTYQKAIEENKRLLIDIKHLVNPDWGIDRLRTQKKWQDHFSKEKEFNILMKQVSSKWMADNPNNPIVKAVNEFKTNQKL